MEPGKQKPPRDKSNRHNAVTQRPTRQVAVRQSQPEAAAQQLAEQQLAAQQLAASPLSESQDSSQDSPDELEMVANWEELASGLFTLFADKIAAERPREKLWYSGDFVGSIMIMLPQSTAGENPPLLTDIMGYCRNPTLNEPMATQGDQDEPENEMRRRKKLAIGELFDPSNGDAVDLSDMKKFHEVNEGPMRELIFAERNYSERLFQASNVNARNLLAVADVSANMFKVVEEPLADLSDFQDLELGGKIIPGVQVDVKGLAYIAGYTQYFASSTVSNILEIVGATVELTKIVSIRIGLTVIQMSVYGLIMLSKYLYDWGMSKLGRFGGTVKYIMDKLWAHKELLFGGPFMDITNPSPESSYNRRMNRLVYLFLYAMIDLLKFINENRVEMSDIIVEVAAAPGFDAQGFDVFLRKGINEWSYGEIFEYGPKLFVYIMGDRGSLKGRLSVFYEKYDKSIKFVTELLDARITHHLVNVRMVPRGKTNKVVINSAPPIRQAKTEQIEEMREAILSSLIIGLDPDSGLEETIRAKGYGDIMKAMREVGSEVGALEPEPQGDAAQSKKKRTRRRRKSKGKNSTKGKKKKGKKKTKRGRKKKVI